MTTPSKQWNVIAPSLHIHQGGQKDFSDAEVFGSVVWLWMQGPNHRNLPLYALDSLLLPAIRFRQYALVIEESDLQTRPIAYVGWANLSAEAESRYIANPMHGLSESDWNSGDRMWCTEFFAPLGQAMSMHRLLRPFFCNASARYLSHKSNERGVKVFTFKGLNVNPAYAKQWWQARPILAFNQSLAKGFVNPLTVSKA